MRYLDKVKLLKDYGEKAQTGDVGVIWLPEIRDNTFFVMFDKTKSDEPYDPVYYSVNIADIELVEEYGLTNEQISQDLPSDEPWLCIVEDGYIKNLNGEKKNKIAYDYDS